MNPAAGSSPPYIRFLPLQTARQADARSCVPASETFSTSLELLTPAQGVETSLDTARTGAYATSNRTASPPSV